MRIIYNTEVVWIHFLHFTLYRTADCACCSIYKYIQRLTVQAVRMTWARDNHFLLVYGSQTGQAKAISEEIAENASSHWLHADLHDLNMIEKKVRTKVGHWKYIAHRLLSSRWYTGSHIGCDPLSMYCTWIIVGTLLIVMSWCKAD